MTMNSDKALLKKSSKVKTRQDRGKEYEWKGQEGRGQYGYDEMLPRHPLPLSLPPSPPYEQGILLRSTVNNAAL
jgi:hypothetical protein